METQADELYCVLVHVCSSCNSGGLGGGGGLLEGCGTHLSITLRTISKKKEWKGKRQLR